MAGSGSRYLNHLLTPSPHHWGEGWGGGPLLLVCLFLFLTLCPALPASAAPPRVAFLHPTGGQRGKTVTVTLGGSDLKEISGFFTTGTGLTAKILPGDKADSRTAEITVAPDTPPGIQEVRFYDKTGLSNPRYFRIGNLPEVEEKEPNNERAAAMRITLPVTVNGRIHDNPDRDGVVFHAKPGEKIVCEVEALRVLGQVGDSWLKGYLEIQDAQGNILAESSGTPDEYYRWDPLIVFEAPKEGDYYLFYRDLNWRGAAMAVYRLTVGVVPHAVGIFPLGGRRGETATVRFAGPNIGDAAAQPIPIPADAPETMNVCLAAAPSATTTNLRPFQVGDLPEAMQADGGPNQSREAAQAVPYPCVVNGRLAKDGARDFYRFTIDKPQKAVLEVFSRRVGTPMDAEISLYDAKGNLLQIDDDARGRDCRIERDLTPGEYAVCIRDVNDRGGPEYPYRLSLSPLRPRFRLIALTDAPTLKRGEKATLTVKLEKEDGFNSDVTVTVSGLPAGVTAEPLTIAKDKAEGQLTLAASADAALGPIRIDVTGTSSGAADAPPVKAIARTQETYNIQGTAFQRDLIGPILFVAEKEAPAPAAPAPAGK